MPIEQGLILNKSNIAVVTESQLFGERAMQRRLRKRQKIDADAIIRNLTDTFLIPGLRFTTSIFCPA